MGNQLDTNPIRPDKNTARRTLISLVTKSGNHITTVLMEKLINNNIKTLVPFDNFRFGISQLEYRRKLIERSRNTSFEKKSKSISVKKKQKKIFLVQRNLYRIAKSFYLVELSKSDENFLHLLNTEYRFPYLTLFKISQCLWCWDFNLELLQLCNYISIGTYIIAKKTCDLLLQRIISERLDAAIDS